MAVTINADDGVVTGSAGYKLTPDASGVLALQTNGSTVVSFSGGTTPRITGDFSNATIANRVIFQTSTTNGNTGLVVIPNGTSTIATFNLYANSDPSNTSTSSLGVNGTAGEAYFAAGRTGAGTYLPMTFYTSGSERVRIDTSGNLQFNSGYGSVATAYGCRAWVNLTDVTNTNLSGTYSQSGTTVTVTATAHGLIVGSAIYSDITTGTGVDGIYTVATVPTANTFTYTAGTSLTTSGNITLLRATVRGSGNVSSVADNAVGDVSVNFSVAMPDANYATVGLPESGDPSAAGTRRTMEVYPSGVTTAYVRVRSGFSSSTQDMPMFIAVFR